MFIISYHTRLNTRLRSVKNAERRRTCVNTLTLGQNGLHFADDTSEFGFFFLENGFYFDAAAFNEQLSSVDSDK